MDTLNQRKNIKKVRCKRHSCAGWENMCIFHGETSNNRCPIFISKKDFKEKNSQYYDWLMRNRIDWG